MTTTEVLARLTAHWPQLGGDGPDATLRLADWAQVIERSSPDVRGPVVETLITGWQGDWHPRIADFQATARAIATRRALEHSTQERQAIEAGAPTPDAVAALIAAAREALTNAKRPMTTTNPIPISKYDQQPVHWGENLMTPEERQGDLDRFGDRKVRTKR